MKKIALAFILSSFLGLSAQVTQKISIDWTQKKKLNNLDSSVEIPQFNLQNFFYNDVEKTLYYYKKFPSNGVLEENNFQISLVNYESISENELGDLNKDNIPNTINFELKNNIAREKLFYTIKFSPIIKTAEGFKKVTSLTFSTNSSRNSQIQVMSSFDEISNSVLNDGPLYRFFVEKSGVYRLTRGFLQQLGFNTNVNPRKIKIYGNGGRMIPLRNSVPYPVDLAENAIQIVGEEDGVFDNQDFILFYAEGVDNWSEENQSNLNLYDNRSYYYITSQGGDGKRIENLETPSSGNITSITTFDDYQFYEKDLVNIGRLGRKWFGEQFNINESQTFTLNFPNIVTSVPVKATIQVAAVSFSTSNFEFKANGQTFSTTSVFPVTASGPIFQERTIATTFSGAETIDLNVVFDNNGVPSANGYLNYINLVAKRNLRGYGKQFRFQYDDAISTLGIGEFIFSEPQSITQVWDITDIYNTKRVENINPNGFTFRANLGEIRKYITVVPNDYFTPSFSNPALVSRQNLKGTIFNNEQGQFQDIDYLIITPNFLKSEADRLANFHRTNSNLNVKVVTLDPIYQEFGSGKQDIGAIRNFVKYVYFNASTPEKRVKYLNLFGDASFDFKNRIINNTNIVPIYHSVNSNSLFSSICSDDFFGMMDFNEGNVESFGQELDIAVGRMLVSTIQQAKEMVDKVIQYYAPESYGRWRNNFSLISDDVDLDWEGSIQGGIDNLGDQISTQKPFVNVFKYHADSYLQETSAGGNRYPKLRQDIINAFEQGSLVFNYFGHGGEDGLAQERIYEKTDAQNLNNPFRYPLFVTVTCELTRFDNPFRQTAGEFTYWNPNGGAISMVTTVRQIGVQQGLVINDFLAANLYGFNSNEEITIAEALRRSKNEYNSPLLMVFYIGDPALQLAIPKPKIVLTHINNVPVSESTFIFNALSFATLKGEVRDENGNQLLENYNGEVAIQIFDKNLNRDTLGNDGTTLNGNLIILNFNELGETIFRGNATVTNGIFEFSFVVPKDIRIPIDSGRISFYAKTNNPVLQDQTGFNTDIQVGGINKSAPEDNVGPTVRLYMNDETFINGGITNESPIFLAFLEDENGINTASGIGHDIVAILDGDESNPFILNDYYETELNNYRKGIVRFPFRNLSVGLHTITFKAWDVYNNPITAEIQFVVVGDDTVTLTNVLNYPNPFVSYTQFWFTHNKPFEPLDVQVQIFTITGKVVKSINQTVVTEGFLSREITWDGRDDFGDKIGKGVYVYKLTVRSRLSNKTAEKIEKLVIL